MEMSPDQSLLKMKSLQMSHCLNPNYVPLDPSAHGWK